MAKTMDVEAFLNRTGRSKADLLRDLGMDPKSSLISSYIKNRSNPSFEVAEKLLKLGMTIKEMFGEEIDTIIRKAYMDEIRPDASNDKDAKAGVERALIDMQARGIIKDEVAREIAAMKAKGLI